MDKESEMATTPTVLPTQAETRRDEDFISAYANNVMVESNAFDLKMIFGIYDHRNALKPVIDQFSSVNIPWPQVKVLILFLQMHVEGYELENGKIKVPDSAVPPDLQLLPAFDNPKGRAAIELFRKMRNEFVASQKS